MEKLNVLVELQESAKNCLKVSNYEYKFSAGKKISDTKFLIAGIDTDDFTHIIGLEHIPSVKRAVKGHHKLKAQLFSKISAGLSETFFDNNDIIALSSPIKETYNSETQSPYSISDRISKTKDLMSTLDRAFNGAIYKWDLKKCNIRLKSGKIRQCTIQADYLLAVPSQQNPDEKMYIFMCGNGIDTKDKNLIKLKIISAFPDCIDLTQGQERAYTILEEEKISKRSMQSELLYTRPTYKKQKEEVALKVSSDVSQNSKPTEFHSLENIPRSVKPVMQNNGTIALAPQAPQSDFFTRIANALVNGLDSIVHKASMAFEKLNVAATKALNSLFAPEQPQKPPRASQSRSKGKSPTKAKTAEMARHAAPAKQSEQKQEKRSSVLADLKTIRTEQAQDKPERSHQRSKSNNQEL